MPTSRVPCLVTGFWIEAQRKNAVATVSLEPLEPTLSSRGVELDQISLHFTAASERAFAALSDMIGARVAVTLEVPPELPQIEA
jgi:hypothetical protein